MIIPVSVKNQSMDSSGITSDYKAAISEYIWNGFEANATKVSICLLYTSSIETSIVGKKAYVAVADTGRGIDEESLPHVFERFHKADKSRGYDKKGTGLGLAIVKQIMLNHQEDIQDVYKRQDERRDIRRFREE